ncbi:MAG: methyltransferase domain-containing protein [Nocardioidaceae bacterium]
MDLGCGRGQYTPELARRGWEAVGIDNIPRAIDAHPGATLLMLAFQPTSVRSVAGGVSRAEVETAFSGWEMLAVEPADTTGWGGR